MSPRKPTTKKMSATVQVAIITTIGTVAVALIAGVFSWAQKPNISSAQTNTLVTLSSTAPNLMATAEPCIVNDFSDEGRTKLNWSIESNSDYGTETTSISNGKYIWAMNASTPILQSKQLILNQGVVTQNRNYQLEVEIQKTTGLDSVKYGVILNQESQLKHYTILISPAEQKLWVNKRTPDANLTLIPSTSFDFINQSGVNALKIIARNSDYQIYINGNLAGEFTDTEYNNGIIKLATAISEINSDVAVEIDNFRLCNIP